MVIDRYRIPLKSSLKICTHHIQLTSRWAGDTLLIADPRRGRGLVAEC